MGDIDRATWAKAIEVVRRQAALPDLIHFDRPSDFRKGVLSALAALEAAMPPEEKDCPHAAPFRYCDGCQVDPCPIGLAGAPRG